MIFQLKTITTMWSTATITGQEEEEGEAVSLSLHTQQTSPPNFSCATFFFFCPRPPPPPPPTQSSLIPWKFPWKSSPLIRWCAEYWIFRERWMFTHVVTLIGPPECLFVIRNESGSLVIAANREASGQKMFLQRCRLSGSPKVTTGERIHKIWSVYFGFPERERERETERFFSFKSRKINAETTERRR